MRRLKKCECNNFNRNKIKPQHDMRRKPTVAIQNLRKTNLNTEKRKKCYTILDMVWFLGFIGTTKIDARTTNYFY